MMKKILLFLSLLFMVGCTQVEMIQGFEAKPHTVTKTLPKVTIDKGMKPIRLHTLHIETKIVGNIAQTTYEMAFYNPNDRVLEGELKLPLLEGQHIVAYALEVNGVYRNSSVVEKAKAKKAYENTIRRNVDPGLVEKTLGNNYRLRLYPLPAKGFKHLKVTVEEILHTKAQKYTYSIPFVSNIKIDDFALELEILSGTPVVGQLYGVNAGLEVFNKGYKIHYARKQFSLDEPIVLTFKNSVKTHLFLEKRRGTNKNYFMAIIPKSKGVQKKASLFTQQHTSMEIVWDTSLSAANMDTEKIFDFLDTFFKDNATGSFDVVLKTIDTQMHYHGHYHVTHGVWKKLKEKIQTLHYNGTKDLSQFRASKRADYAFVFTNGINSMSDSVKVSKKIPLYVFNASSGAASNTMQYMAAYSKGKYIDLLRHNSQVALKKLYSNERMLIGKKSASVSDLYQIDRGDVMVLLGRIKGDRGSVAYTIQGKAYRVDIERYQESDIIARVWANAKIDKLSLEYKKNKTKIISLAKQYKVVTKDTSLIVLDRVEDYIQYEILPPKKLRKKYDALLKKKKVQDKAAKKRVLDEAIRLLKEEKKWYRTHFPKKRIKIKDEEVRGEGGDIMPVAPLAAMASAPQISKRKKSKQGTSSSPQIKLKAWSPDVAYIKALHGVKKKNLLSKYYVLQKEHLNEVSFYVDMSDYFFKKGLQKESLLILSNILELDFDNSEFIRVFAFKLMEQKRYRTSLYFFKKITELRPFELQSFRDLALAYERNRMYQKALNLHYKIITNSWDGRFYGAKIVAINELNHLITKHRLNLRGIDRRLIASMPVDMRIVINWSTDNTDMDLWVIDPSGEKTYYGNRTSHMGGKISNDMTRGYGPEEYMIKKAPKGKYVIKVKYYASSQQKLTGPTVIRAEVYTKYGKGNEHREEIVFRVEEEKDIIELGEVVY